MPGIFQSAFVATLAGADPPFWPTGYLWIVPLEGDHWMARPCPNVGETAPPRGDVGFMLMPRAAIEEVWNARGW